MHLRFKPWQLAALLVVVCAGAIAGVYFYKTARGSDPADLASYLPLGDGTLVYIDVDAMRRSGILELIAGKKAAADLEYQSFINATKFDYRDDLDTVVALFKTDQVFMTLRGRFDWKALIKYAGHNGGECNNSFCTVPGSRPDRRISFYPIRSDLMGLAVSRDNWAAYQITRRTARLPIVPPRQPVWAVLTGGMLKNITSLPSGTKSFASALESANQMVFTIGEEGQQLQLGVDVKCDSADKASVLLNQLETTTSTLRRWLEREHQQPNADDLSSVLTAGSFRREDRQVHGTWPLSRGFVEAVAGGPN